MDSFDKVLSVKINCLILRSNIILRQVNRLANEQLDFLSSGRYQLKAEGIDEKHKTHCH